MTLLCFILISLGAYGQNSNWKKSFECDQNTALQLSKIFLKNEVDKIQGDSNISSQIMLVDDEYWKVQGNVVYYSNDTTNIPFEINIDKKNCRIRSAVINKNSISIHIDKKDAIDIAKVVFSFVFKKDKLENYVPFIAVQKKKNSWCVRGSWRKGKWSDGGVPYIEINKYDGEILRLGHEK